MSALVIFSFGAGYFVTRVIALLVGRAVRVLARRVRPPRSIDEAQSARWDAEQLAAERLPFLLEAQREVDRLLPGTPPIAPPELLPAPAPAYRAAHAPAAAEPVFYGIGDGLRWAVLSNHDLALAYWRARADDSPVLDSLMREIKRRNRTMAARGTRND